MKKTTKGYKVDIINGKIYITKAFAKLAGDVTTKECKEFAIVRKTYPTYTIEYKTIDRNEDKVSYNGLNIFKMKAFIQLMVGDEALKEFEKYEKLFDKEQGKYPKLKKIFLNTYKDKYNSVNEKEMLNIDLLADELREQADKAKNEKVA